MDVATMVRAGLLDQIVARMISAKARPVRQGQGLGASKRMIDGQIVNIPAFRNFAGQFDQTPSRPPCRARI